MLWKQMLPTRSTIDPARAGKWREGFLQFDQDFRGAHPYIVQPERASHGASDAPGARPGKLGQRLDRP